MRSPVKGQTIGSNPAVRVRDLRAQCRKGRKEWYAESGRVQREGQREVRVVHDFNGGRYRLFRRATQVVPGARRDVADPGGDQLSRDSCPDELIEEHVGNRRH